MIDVPPSVLSLFTAAGWRPGRRAGVPRSIPFGHPAAEILAQFGRLWVRPEDAPECECAPSDIFFRQPEFVELNFVPEVWGKLLNTQLVGIAITSASLEALYVDTSQRYFGANLIDTETFYLHGASFAEAMEGLLLGRRARLLLRPDQTRVALYGKVFTPDHPGIYKYR